MLVKTPDTLADNDFEFTLLVLPIVHVAPVNPHCEGAVRGWQEVPIAGITVDKARLFLSQFGFQTLGHLERIIAHRFDVQREASITASATFGYSASPDNVTD